MGLNDSSIPRLEQIISRRRRIPRDGALYRMNDAFVHLYAVRHGHFKTYQLDASGAQQITGFQMAGELLGMDAIGTGRYQCDAIALEDSEVCEIPYFELEQLFLDSPRLVRQFHRLLSDEISRERNVILLLRNMRAEQRVAVFLTGLSARYAARGFSETSFQLPMTREEISCHLGLAMESICRELSKLKQSGLLNIRGRRLDLPNPGTLREMATGARIDR